MTLSELESARLQLSRETRLNDPELTRCLHQVARVAATTLNVDRVSIWVLDEAWSEIECRLLFDRRLEQFTVGARIPLTGFPRYTQALRERRVIAAENALLDPRTSELGSSYLVPNGVGALLDCPVYENGNVVAVVCHESVGGPRAWSKRDSDFAVSVAELLSTITAQAARLGFEAELRRARDALTQAQVMDSLGRMAAEAAHDFNNVLTGIALSLQIVAEALPPQTPPSTAQLAARDALALVDQGANLVRQLLTFARQGTYAGSPTDIAQALESCLPRLRRLLGPDVTLTVDLERTSGAIRMDISLFEQVLTNLLVNARDAMPGGGQLWLTSRRTDQRITLSLRDTGVGMSEEVRQRIFEPFFSTKGPGGNGLGLSIVFGAVRGIGGEIRVDSEPGRGSTFTLELPLDGAGSVPPLRGP